MTRQPVKNSLQFFATAGLHSSILQTPAEISRKELLSTETFNL